MCEEWQQKVKVRHMRCEFLLALSMSIMILWALTSYSTVIYGVISNVNVILKGYNQRHSMQNVPDSLSTHIKIESDLLKCYTLSLVTSVFETSPLTWYNIKVF